MKLCPQVALFAKKKDLANSLYVLCQTSTWGRGGGLGDRAADSGLGDPSSIPGVEKKENKQKNVQLLRILQIRVGVSKFIYCAVYLDSFATWH